MLSSRRCKARKGNVEGFRLGEHASDVLANRPGWGLEIVDGIPVMFGWKVPAKSGFSGGGEGGGRPLHQNRSHRQAWKLDLRLSTLTLARRRQPSSD